jgi:hypothetical protein
MISEAQAERLSKSLDRLTAIVEKMEERLFIAETKLKEIEV